MRVVARARPSHRLRATSGSTDRHSILSRSRGKKKCICICRWQITGTSYAQSSNNGLIPQLYDKYPMPPRRPLGRYIDTRVSCVAILEASICHHGKFKAHEENLSSSVEECSIKKKKKSQTMQPPQGELISIGLRDERGEKKRKRKTTLQII